MLNIKTIIKSLDKKLLFITLFMLVFGLINIVTASSREAVVVNEQGIYYYFYRQIVVLGVGFVLAVAALCFPTESYKKYGLLAYIFALATILYCFTQKSNRGAQNWIPLFGGFQFQPSEFGKIALIMYLSFLFEFKSKILRNPNDQNYKKTVGIIFIVMFAIPSVIFVQKDLGTASIILFIVGILFLLSPMKFKSKLKFIGIGLLCALLFLGVYFVARGYILTEAQIARITEFWRPCSKYETGGYQTCNAQIAINDGGLLGLGIGKSKQKYSYIPEPHTDSIFAIIAEEWGVISCLFFVFIPYAFILYRIFDIANKSITLRGKYICIGVGCYIFAHIFINLGGLIGLIPLTGVPLPFLSYGGTYTICLLIALSLVQRVHVETKNKRFKVKTSN